MLIRKYSIVMQTKIGDRSGTMDVQITKGKILGNLNVLNRSEPFEGTLDNDGRCQICGTLVTLMSHIPYTADGIITENSLNLLFRSEAATFPIIGKTLTRNMENTETDGNKIAQRK